MPKQIHKIDQFHGGLNSNSDPRDIAENELSESVDVMVDALGKIRTLGGTEAHDASSAPTVQMNPGYGLFQFSTDKTINSEYSVPTVTNAGEARFYYSGDPELELYDVVFHRGFANTNYNGYKVLTAHYPNSNWYKTGENFLSNDTGYLAKAVDVSDTGENWIALVDTYGSEAAVFLYSETNGEWYRVISLGGVTYPEVKPCFFYADGALRISDGEFSRVEMANKWFGHVGRKFFGESSASGEGNQNYFELIDDWVVENAALTPLAIRSFDGFGGGDWPTASYPIAMDIASYSNNSGDWTGEWEVAVSTLYDDCKQESLLATIDSTVEFGVDTWHDNTKAKVDFHLFNSIPADHKRVSGFRVYMREVDTKTWYLQSEIDMRKGNRWFYQGDYSRWEDSQEMPGSPHCDGEYLDTPRRVETYETMTGFDAELDSLGFESAGEGYKTATVLNRRVYVGNVRMKDQSGQVKVLGDAMLKSSVGKFDQIPFTNRIDVDVNDGDEIVKLEGYADRILQFKKNKMHLINVSQEIEFLEGTFMYKGVDCPAAVCKTDYGVAWVNKYGVYLYDGEQVQNLFEKKGVQIINESNWASFVDGNEPMIGYIPQKRQLIIVDDNTSGGDGAIYLYDMVTQSWIKGANGTIVSNDLTNFINDWNGDLVFAHTAGTLLKWTDTSASSSSFELKTKDIDFGQPAQRKKVYKIYVTYKSTGDSHIQVYYMVDGEPIGSQKAFDWISSAYYGSGTLDDSSGEWQVAELVPGTSSEANNIKSIKLRFWTGGTVPSDFEINDISIIYRLKSIK